MAASLKHLVLEFGRDEIQLRALYHSEAKDSLGLWTKARKREVKKLSVEGPTATPQAFDGSARVDVIGTSGYDVREDTISAEGRKV
jgi:hypothetical protein